MRFILVVVSFCLLEGGSLLAQAEKEKKEPSQVVEDKKLSLKIGLDLGLISGHTTSRFEHDEGASELEYPLNNPLIGLMLNLGHSDPILPKYDRVRFTLRWFTNAREDAGIMKDSDWIENDGHPGLDIYSESDARLKANLVDLCCSYNFFLTKRIGLGFMIGCFSQSLDYEIYDVNQVGYGPYHPAYTGSVSGKVLTYEVKYQVPYFGVYIDSPLGESFRLNLQVGYSSMARARDDDHHILREIFYKGKGRGVAQLFRFNLHWNFRDDSCVELVSSSLNINTVGTMDIISYEGSTVEIYENLPRLITTSLQNTISLSFGYRF